MKLSKRILNIAKIINNDNIFVYSAQASFYIIIASIPFIMLLLSLAQYILPVSESDVIGMANAFMPETLKPSALSVISELFYKSSGSVISITAISSLWTASRGIAAVERGTRNVYHTPNRTNFISGAVLCILYTLMFMIILLVFLATVVFGNSITKFLELKSGIWCWVFGKTSWLKWLFFFISLTAFFSLVYKTFSGRKIPVRRQLPGAVFTSLGWMIFSILFSFYIDNFANYSYIYGSLAALVLMMLWVYSCMIIFLLGGEINISILIRIIRNKKALEAERITDSKDS
ncbi:MAG: YihY/virulence factor BrkB family protein [Firmicutes bacterium]|nr:YihY/virulence factor BrkB family protein [Bacillota bacterium]